MMKNTWSRVSGPRAEFLYDESHKFQNFWNSHKIPEFFERAHNDENDTDYLFAWQDHTLKMGCWHAKFDHFVVTNGDSFLQLDF
jgi:hypothetical protein